MRNLTSDVHNNEVITGISILSVLKHTRHMPISKVMLIEPLLSYSKVLSLLKRKGSSVISIEDLIIKENLFFSNFSDRYSESFVLSINSVMLFVSMGFLRISDGEIVFTGDEFNFYEDMGKRARERIEASRKLADILEKATAEDLYLSLRVKV